MKFVINTRVLGTKLTGAQRYTLELLTRFKGEIQEAKPINPLSGIRGHAWEQFVLPTKLQGRLLWVS